MRWSLWGSGWRSGIGGDLIVVDLEGEVRWWMGGLGFV